MLHQKKIAVIGLGYVGLPLAIEFAAHLPVVGFDIDKQWVTEIYASSGDELKAKAEPEKLQKVLVHSTERFEKGLFCTTCLEQIASANIFIVTVPTPIDRYNSPDLSILMKASEMVGKVLKRGDIVVYESTVYPGCTEEECIPVLERKSGLKFNEGFFVGYSPERINPGDTIHTLTKIKKITSGSTPEIADEIDNLYRIIIEAGTHKAPSIKVAEASKAIENAQRDVNISFVNELALIFDRMGIDTNDVLDAAGTKWNFLKFKPGLVGGHCISVDPYYLAHKAVSLGYHPQVILSGRRVNDLMGEFVAGKVVKLMIANGHKVRGAKVLLMGITFKENCPDIRNSKIKDIYFELKQFGIDADVYDPFANAEDVKREFGIELVTEAGIGQIYEAVIIAVAHTTFLNFDFKKYKDNRAVIFDIKACLKRELADARL